MSKTISGILITGLLCLIPKTTIAGIVTMSGQVEFISSPPSDVRSNQWESDTFARIFQERQAFTLTQPVSVDVSLPGTVRLAPDDLSPATIGVGTVLNSFYLHVDSISENSIDLRGSITFDSDIIGVITGVKDGITSNDFGSSLALSNSILGRPGVSYSRGATDLLPQDFFTITPDLRTLTFRLTTVRGDDNLRIITSVPEPSGFLLVLSTTPLLSLSMRRKRVVQVDLH
jgi:hypothetical protein